MTPAQSHNILKLALKTLLTGILLISIFTINAFAQNIPINVNQSDWVKLELNKLVYDQGDTIHLLITNLTKDTFKIANIHFASECIKLKMKKEKEWKQLSFQGYSGGIYPGLRHTFLPGEEINYQWNQKYIHPTIEHPASREFVSIGIYRFEFYFTHKPKYTDPKTNSYVTFSKEFEIR